MKSKTRIVWENIKYWLRRFYEFLNPFIIVIDADP